MGKAACKGVSQVSSSLTGGGQGLLPDWFLLPGPSGSGMGPLPTWKEGWLELQIPYLPGRGQTNTTKLPSLDKNARKSK